MLSLIDRYAAFIPSSTSIAWSVWVQADAITRNEYRVSVAAVSATVLERIETGALTPEEGALEAHDHRNRFLERQRDKTSPIGLVIARILKLDGHPCNFYLEKYAKKKYGRSFADLEPEETKEVAMATIKGAGRANAKVSLMAKISKPLSHGLVAVTAAVSLYSVVAAAKDWQYEMDKQVFLWIGSVACSKTSFIFGIGARVRGFVGLLLPVGGVLASILGGIEAKIFVDWLFRKE